MKGLLKPKRLRSTVIVAKAVSEFTGTGSRVARADARCAKFEYGVMKAESEVTELLYR